MDKHNQFESEANFSQMEELHQPENEHKSPQPEEVHQPENEHKSPQLEPPPEPSEEHKSPQLEPPEPSESDDRESDSTLLGGWFDPNKASSPPPLSEYDWLNSSEKNGKKQTAYLSPSARELSSSLLALIGYGLLILALFDYIQIIFPPNFTNQFWEFETIGRLVERVPVPLLGFLLVFYRPEGNVDRSSLHLLRFLSWLSLLLGLMYFLIIPLGINNTRRIYNNNNAQINARIEQSNQRLQPIKSQLEQSQTDREIQNMLASLSPQGKLPEIDNPQELKDKLLTQIARAESTIRMQAETVRANRRQVLLKNSVKWNLGALVSGTLFIMIWHMTRWVRIKFKR